MPRLTGLELRERIQANKDLRMKCIPFIFFTTAANKKFVLEAYHKSIQGFFQKPNTSEELENKIKIIIEYWNECIAPNQV